MTNVRELLVSLGVSQMNATIIINKMFTNPATTDPASPAIVLLVKHLQQVLAQLGANVQVTGRLDQPTNAALESLLPGWLYRPWSEAVKAVVTFRDQGASFSAGPVGVSVSMGSMPLGLPDVPGGLLTYIAGAAVAWHFWNKR